jgi:hypothetical protein
MYLMRTYLQRVDKITPSCWFFYQVIIYFITGIPNELWNQIQNLPLPETNKQILSSIKNGHNIDLLEYTTPVLRNYFGKGYQMIVSQKEEFKANFIHLVFYLVGFVYKKSSTEGQAEGDIQYACCSMLLIYLF